jgi:hypothetical protein
MLVVEGTSGEIPQAAGGDLKRDEGPSGETPLGTASYPW